ncbi:MAG: large conductance mechanosensitive channel protein MscL [Candidatus Sumerlaeia bacterium]|nr:large conductance mechanosensitive channel protein MscL [Candidatus Sumerlaeia bacterium]
MLKEFKTFISRGNVVDMAVGIIIGSAFTTIVKSLVDDVIMPPLGYLLGQVDFSEFQLTLTEGVSIRYGAFLNAVVSFLIVAWAVFLLVKAVNRMRGPAPAEAPATKECPRCCGAVPIKATRCPMCTSDLG